MKITTPGYEIITPMGKSPALSHIERCGRVCYKSEDKITDESAVGFVSRIIKRGHEAVLEHFTFIFQMDNKSADGLLYTIQQLNKKGFLCFLRYTKSGRFVISGNIRAWRDFMGACYSEYSKLPGYMQDFVEENPVLFPEYQDTHIFSLQQAGDVFYPLTISDLETETEMLIHYDMTVKFICDRGVSHEIVRHRPASYCQESTRYCNYSKGDFGGEITVIKPMYLDPGTNGYRVWKESCEAAERGYFSLLEYGCTPQEARAVLPNSLKTEVVMTANLYEWRHFLRLRSSVAAHPQMREVVAPLARELHQSIPVIFDAAWEDF